MIKILIADDHAVVRRGLRQIVEETPDMAIAGEAANATELFQCLQEHPLDLLILDITMPGRSGLDLLQDIRQLHPRLPILVLSMHAEEQFAARVLQAGAAGYLPKESAPEELVQAIQKIHSGQTYIRPSQADKLLRLLKAGSNRPPHETLSQREFEVFRRLASGQTVGQIASELHLSVKTVSTYRKRTLEKMSLPTNAALTRYALQNQLLD
jgi:two-component system invasion response regulator UvrY